MPPDSSSSYTFKNVSKLCYKVTALIKFRIRDRDETLFKSKEVFVVDRWTLPVIDVPKTVSEGRKNWNDGPVHLEATLQPSYATPGTNVSLHIKIDNSSKRKIHGIKVTFVRRLMMLKPGSVNTKHNTVKIITQNVEEVIFNEKQHVFYPNECRSTSVYVSVPKDMATIRNTSLCEIVCRIIVSISMRKLINVFAKDLSVELPIDVCHIASIAKIPAKLNHVPECQNMLTSTPMNRLETDPFKGRVLPWTDNEADSTPALLNVKHTSPDRIINTRKSQILSYTPAHVRNVNLSHQVPLMDYSYEHIRLEQVPLLDNSDEPIRQSHEAPLLNSNEPIRRHYKPLPAIPSDNYGFLYGMAKGMVGYAVAPLNFLLTSDELPKGPPLNNLIKSGVSAINYLKTNDEGHLIEQEDGMNSVVITALSYDRCESGNAPTLPPRSMKPREASVTEEHEHMYENEESKSIII